MNARKRAGGVAAVTALLVVASASLEESGAVGSAMTATAPIALSGCFTPGCDFEYVIVESHQGVFLDADTWVSGPLEGDWLEFPGQRQLALRPDFGGRVPDSIITYISVGKQPQSLDPNIPRQGYSIAAGNAAIYNWTGPNAIDVLNGTCANYFAHIVVHAPPFPPAPPVEEDAGDAGDDAGTNDASVDATIDAGVDANDAS